MAKSEFIIWRVSERESHYLLGQMHPNTIRNIVGANILQVAIEKFSDFQSLTELFAYAGRCTNEAEESEYQKLIRIVTPILIGALYDLVESRINNSNIIKLTEKDFV